MSVRLSSTTLFGVPFPLPTPQGRRASRVRTVPEREIRMLRNAIPGHGGQPPWQTYSGRNARVAARFQGQAAQPYKFRLPERL